MIWALNEATELCLLPLHVKNIVIPFGNVLLKQGEDFSTLNIPVSSSTFPPVPNTPGQWLPHGSRSMQGTHICGPRKNSYITGIWKMGKHISLGASVQCANAAQAACASMCTTSLGSCWCCYLWRSPSKHILKIPGLSYHPRANETGIGHSLKLASCEVWKCLSEWHCCPTCWGNQPLKQISIPELPSLYSKHSQ